MAGPSHSWDTGGSECRPPGRRRSWEGSESPDPAPRRRRSWEELPPPPAPFGLEVDGDSDEEGGPQGEAEQAAEQFAQLLLEKYFESSLSAETVCNMAYFCAKAGMKGMVEQLGMPPGPSGGNYQRHIRKVLGFRPFAGIYEMDVPGVAKYALGRTSVPLTCIPVHEALQQELEQEPDLPAQLESAIADGKLPPSYLQHPLVTSSDDLVVPFCLYMDGVAYSQTDSVVAFWAYNMITTRRHLVCLVRKKAVCQCGCRGRDTFWPVLAWLHWSCKALYEGTFPTTRHDGVGWRASDSARAALAGKPMTKKACLIYLKGDWAEFCARFGFPTWNSNLRPCFCCAAFGSDLASADDVTLDTAPWHINDDRDYSTACDRAEIKVVVDRPLVEKLTGLLRYDKRRDGSHGRALTADVPECNLLAGDRLEPCAALFDVGCLEYMAAFPATLVFWRVKEQSLCQFRCPLWDPELHITPTTVVCIDLMHTLHLGVMLEFGKEAVWALLGSSIWNTGVDLTAEEQVKVKTMLLRNDLWAWYRARAKSHPHETLTTVQDVTQKMIGTPGDPCLKAKAAEAWGLVLYFTDKLGARRDVIGAAGADLLRVGRSITRFMDIVHANKGSGSLSRQARVDMLDCVKAMHNYMPERSRTPKLHLMVHLVLRSSCMGNPALGQTFRDEGLNKKLKQVCRNCHSNNFELTAFFKMAKVLSLDHERYCKLR